MNIDQHSNNQKSNPNKSLKQDHLPASGNLIAIFTGLLILLRMRDTLGLEAMLDYMAKYAAILGKAHPQVAQAVFKAIESADFEKIYREAVHPKN